MGTVKLLKWAECHFGQEVTFQDLRLQILLLLMATGVFSGKYFVERYGSIASFSNFYANIDEELSQ